MNQLVEPFQLTTQQEEYILSGHAAFLTVDQIVIEVTACFPEWRDQIIENYPTTWEKRLELSVRRLYPAHPEFPEKYKSIFPAMRRTYISTISDEMLSSSRVRLSLMTDTMRELENYGKEYPDRLVETSKLKLEILKAAKTESYEFADRQTGKLGMTEEEIKALIKSLPQHQLTEFKERYKSGEHPDLILADIQISVEGLNAPEEEEETEDDA